MNTRAWGMAQVVDHLLSKHQALSSNPSAAKRKLIHGKDFYFECL
jgi:hypothetical protein